ncbi:MAG TPA: heme biosynthesis HemY N-terminal domain-containing protein [Micropepsaceae bacterium]|nr:heme biosynthesis HemY N-terminal domain-containing protein [Micropepsaceae bacterium]
MTRLIGILVAAGLIGLGAAWLADNDGVLAFTMAGYEIRMSASVALLLLLIFSSFLALILRGTFALLRGPDKFGSFLASRRARKGYHALSRGLVAAAAGDKDEATISSGRAEALIPAQPLTLLLKAQAAQLAGRGPEQEEICKAMLEHPETRFLGLRGLFAIALSRRNEQGALEFASRAYALNTKSPWALSALFDLRVARHEWHDAQALVAQALRRRVLDQATAKRRRAVLLAAEAMDAEHLGDAANALGLSMEALSLAPGLTPAALIAVAHLRSQGRSFKAQDVIEAAWAEAPHPDLAKAYGAIFVADDTDAHVKRMSELAQKNPNNRESRILMAELGIAEKRWDEARAILEPIADSLAGWRVCRMMEEIARGQDDAVNAEIWSARAQRSPRNAGWVCAECQRGVADWAPTCPNCGAFDALAWTARAAGAPPPPAPSVTRDAQHGLVPDPIAQARQRALAEATSAPLLHRPDDPGPEGQLDMFEAEAASEEPERSSPPVA